MDDLFQSLLPVGRGQTKVPPSGDSLAGEAPAPLVPFLAVFAGEDGPLPQLLPIPSAIETAESEAGGGGIDPLTGPAEGGLFLISDGSAQSRAQSVGSVELVTLPPGFALQSATAEGPAPFAAVASLPKGGGHTAGAPHPIAAWTTHHQARGEIGGGSAQSPELPLAPGFGDNTAPGIIRKAGSAAMEPAGMASNAPAPAAGRPVGAPVPTQTRAPDLETPSVGRTPPPAPAIAALQLTPIGPEIAPGHGSQQPPLSVRGTEQGAQVAARSAIPLDQPMTSDRPASPPPQTAERRPIATPDGAAPSGRLPSTIHIASVPALSEEGLSDRLTADSGEDMHTSQRPDATRDAAPPPQTLGVRKSGPVAPTMLATYPSVSANLSTTTAMDTSLKPLDFELVADAGLMLPLPGPSSLSISTTSLSASSLAPGSAQTTTHIAQQIAAALPERSRDNGHPIELALDPPELGRVRLQMVETAGMLTLTIHADRPETADLMRRHLDLLAQEFAEAGVHAPSVHISHGGADGRTGGSADRDPDRETTAEDSTGITAAPVADVNSGNRSSALDLRL